MKTIRLLIAALLLSSTAASASDGVKSRFKTKERTPEVLLMMDGDGCEAEILEFDSPEKAKMHLREKADRRERAKDVMCAQLAEFDEVDILGVTTPSLIVAQKDNKFAFGIGGSIILRTSYDFKGTVQDIDFVTADIPVPGNYATRQQLMMDASTSCVFLKGVVNTRALGTVNIFVDLDFRGNTGYGDTGITNGYTPRVRRAFASFLGVTIGRDVTTFCDTKSAPQTIDFQGPSAYAFNYATLIRYTYVGCNDRFKAAIAAEQPNVSGTYDSTFEPIPQRVPDVPMFVQYQFGMRRQSHLRVSGVLRDLYAYNATTEENTSLFGWGVQLSGRLNPVSWMGVCFNGTYGKGISPYIQDLIGLGLDFTPDPTNPASLQTMPMYAWQAAANFNLTDRLSANGGYSRVKVEKENGYYTDTQYKKSQYVFGNLFYSVTPRLQVACEYIFGSRRNMNDQYNSANRASLMAQYNF